MILTSDFVEIRLKEAIMLLKRKTETTTLAESPRLHLLYTLLVTFEAYSASGNSIPGYSGLGLHEMLTLANNIIDVHGDLSEKDINIHSYKHLAQAFNI